MRVRKNSARSGASAQPERLIEAFRHGDRLACARVLTLAENDPGGYAELREQFGVRTGRSIRIGITGPPGVGKSTLNALLAEELANRNHRVGVVAVDPSSPFTGGAFMGDRIRMDRLAGNERVFIRSLASREGRGGLSPATPRVIEALEAFGSDRILIETVGVGQAELDVLDAADLVVLVLQPGTGDAIQSMKAGILEAADVIVVNKADQPGLDSMLQSLRFVCGMGGRQRDHVPPALLATSAQRSEGIEALVDEIESRAKARIDSGRHAEAVVRRIEREIREELARRLWDLWIASKGLETELRRAAERIAEHGGSPIAAARDIGANLDSEMRSD